MNVAIVLITFNRIELLTRCLNSLITAIRAPQLHHRYSIHIGVNGQDEKAKEYLYSFSDIDLHVHQWDQRKRLGEARNTVLSSLSNHGDYEWLYFLDDDVEIESNQLSRFEEKLAKFPDLKVIGGPNQHLRPKNQCQQAQEDALSSYFVAGPFSARYREGTTNLDAPISQLILCNLFIKNHSELYFRDSLVGAEENELLNRLLSSHRPFSFFPDLAVHHERRQTVSSFFAQCIQIGKGRGQWEAVRRPYLFRFFSLWIILIGLFFLYWTAVSIFFFNFNQSSAWKARYLVITALYKGYAYGLAQGAFLKQNTI